MGKNDDTINMTFHEMLTNLFDVSFMGSEELETICKAGELYAMGKMIELLKAAKQLLHLHSCEQEGLLSGKPTPKMWFDAVNKLSEAVAAFPTNESKPVK